MDNTIEDCGRCSDLALKMAPGEQVTCEECGTTLAREPEGSPKYKIKVVS